MTAVSPKNAFLAIIFDLLIVIEDGEVEDTSTEQKGRLVPKVRYGADLVCDLLTGGFETRTRGEKSSMYSNSSVIVFEEVVPSEESDSEEDLVLRVDRHEKLYDPMWRMRSLCATRHARNREGRKAIFV